MPSLFTPQGQMAVLSPAVMFPQMFPEDRYGKDPGWRPNGRVFALEAKGGPVNEFGQAPNHGSADGRQRPDDGDIVHETDLITAFAHLGGAMGNIPIDRTE